MFTAISYACCFKFTLFSTSVSAVARERHIQKRERRNIEPMLHGLCRLHTGINCCNATFVLVTIFLPGLSLSFVRSNKDKEAKNFVMTKLCYGYIFVVHVVAIFASLHMIITKMVSKKKL